MTRFRQGCVLCTKHNIFVFPIESRRKIADVASVTQHVLRFSETKFLPQTANEGTKRRCGGKVTPTFLVLGVDTLVLDTAVLIGEFSEKK